MDHETLHPVALELAGVSLPCAFEYPGVVESFGAFCSPRSCGGEPLRIPAAYWDFLLRSGYEKTAAGEFSFFSAVASDALLPHDRCLIHAAALRCRGAAYLFCAAPGVGKSTQLRCLQQLYPGEFSVICGDRPVLQAMPDGSVLVHPSPWNGKEGWQGAGAAPLAAVLCLERGETTLLEELSVRDAVIPLYSSLISQHGDEQTVRGLARMTAAVLKAAPAYRYVNGGVPDSTRYLYHRLFENGGPSHAL